MNFIGMKLKVAKDRVNARELGYLHKALWLNDYKTLYMDWYFLAVSVMINGHAFFFKRMTCQHFHPLEKIKGTK